MVNQHACKRKYENKYKNKSEFDACNLPIRL